MFVKMFDFELRGVIYGNDLYNDRPFVDLRRKNGVYTANAICGEVEAEITIGRRWFRRDINRYASAALERLRETLAKMSSDKEYMESIRNNNVWGAK